MGYVVPSVAAAFRGRDGWALDDESVPKSLTLTKGHDNSSRSAAVKQTLLEMRAEGTFFVLSRWRDEVKPVYGPGGETLFVIERAAAALFGLVTYGIQLTAFTRSEQNEYRIWLQKRSQNTASYPGLLDNTAAGGMPVGERPLETAIREAAEEASLEESLVRPRIKSCGTVSYIHLRDSLAVGEVGLVQPQIEYLFELEMPSGKEPKPCDNEVEWFRLLDIDQIKSRLTEGMDLI